ncbi:MAG: laminin G domain-containing protein [Nannocystis sp.]|nr:laminin G domain-containing protein [Nannocystis sp.]
MATNTQTNPSSSNDIIKRKGAVFGGGVHLALPEMAVSFARGLVIQAWVRPASAAGSRTILRLGSGDAEITFGLVNGAPTLELGGLSRGVAPFKVTVGAWTRVAVVLGREGVTFYRGDEAFAGGMPGASPLEVGRDGNFIGACPTAGAEAFAGAIGDVRLWNRSDSAAAIIGSGAVDLRGDEPGLVGWWTLGRNNGALDRSPFGRDGAFGGGDVTQGSDSFTVERSIERCLDFGQGQGVVDTQAVRLGKVLTWQAHVRVRDLKRMATLLDLRDRSDAARFVRVTTRKGVLTATQATGTTTTTITTKALLKADTWTSVALRISDDQKLAFFVDGIPLVDVSVESVDTVESVNTGGGFFGKLSKSLISQVAAQLGAGLDGQMAEVRLWSRALSSAEIADTWKRRIHGWAPGLVGCWRMEETLQAPSTGQSAKVFEDGDFTGKSSVLKPGSYDAGQLGIGNDTLSSIRVPRGLKVTVFQHGGFAGASATYISNTPLVADNDGASSIKVEVRPGLINMRAAGPQAWVHGAEPAPREGLVLDSAPKVAPVRVAGLSKGALALPTVPAISAAGFSAQMWVNLDPSDGPAPILTLSAAKSVPKRLSLETLGAGSRGRETLGAGGRARTVEALPVITIKASPAGTSFDLDVEVGVAVDAPASGSILEKLANAGTAALAAAARTLRVDSALTARRWTHLTITLDGDGLLCVYSDGRLVRREEKTALAAQDLTPVVGPVAGSVSELRIWSRALTRDEVEAGWQRRLSGAAGLVGRWALENNMSGKPGDAQGAVIWREAPGLAIQSGAAAARPTVKARASLLADQTGKGGNPQLCVDLRARDADGRSLPGCAIEVIVGETIATYRKTVRKENKIADPRRFSITTDARGVARLAFVPKALAMPVLKVRHAGMGEGEWALITPDQVLHEALASLTVNEVRKGRRASATSKAGQEGLCTDGAEDLVEILRGLLGVAASFSFEAESTAALAFGDLEDEGSAEPPSPLSPVLASGEGYVMEFAEDVPLVRRIGRPIAAGAAEDDDAGPVSFGFLGDAWTATTEFVEGGVDFVGEVVEDGADALKDAGEAAIDLGLRTYEYVEKTASAVVENVTLAVNTTINGVTVALKWIVKTVEEVASAVEELFKTIGKTVGEVLTYLAELFDWGDILETCDLMLSTVKDSIKTTRGGVQGLFAGAKGAIVGLEAKVLAALGGEAALPASVGEARTEAAEADPPETPGLLDYLLSLLPDDLSATIKAFQEIFDPISGTLTSALGRLSGLAEGLGAEWNDPALQAAISDPKKLLDSDPADWLAIARLLVRVVVNATALALDFVGDLLVAIIDSFERLLNLRLAIPYLTDFVEEHVLGGREMTAGRLLCLVAAIPTTVLYKAITGRKEGPAALASAGPQSFGAEDGWLSPAVDICSRAFDIVASAFGGIIDSKAAILGKQDEGATDPLATVKRVKWFFDLANALIGAAPLIIGCMDKEEWDADEWVRFGLDAASWICGALSVIADAIDFWKENPVAGWTGVIAGLLGDAIGVISGILNIIFTAKDDATSKLDVTIASLDLTATVASLCAGVAGIVAENTKEGISKTVSTGVVIGGNVVSVGAKLGAVVVVAIQTAT